MYQHFMHEDRPAMCKQTYQKYLQYVLTSEELKENLYPNKRYPIYQEYHEIDNI